MVTRCDVSIRGAEISYGTVKVLEKFDLEVAQSEFIVLLGPSGCGKSTLLNAVAGLVDLSDGQIWIGGNNVTWQEPKDRGIAMVFQSYALYPRMTVRGNMSFGLKVAGVPAPEIARRVDSAATMLQIAELLDRRPAELSGGQRQRVAIGRALVRDAGVFLFDEPLSNLDAKLRSELRRELKQLHKELGATMIYVTHDQVEAMTLATRIAVMKAGKIQQIDSPAAVYNRPVNMFVAGFLGAPSMNFIEGRIECINGTVHFVSPTLLVDVSAYPFANPPQNNLPAVLGVRPEYITLSPQGTEHAGQATVALVEPMGANQVVWLDAQGVSLAVEADAQFAPAPDRRTGFAIDAAHVSLFDLASQQRL